MGFDDQHGSQRSGWRFLGWAAYVLFAIFCSFIALVSAGPWFTLVLALVFIFGPRVWLRL